MPFIAFYHTHKLVVVLFILIYLTKAILLLMSKGSALEKFNKFIRIPEIVVSALLFITGLVMLSQIANFTLLFATKLLLVVIVLPVAIIAYKKLNKFLAILAVLILITVYGMAEMYKAQFAKKQDIEVALSDATLENYSIETHGKALFDAQCIVCHGDDGKAMRSGAKDLTMSTKSDAEMIELIKNGKNTMPSMNNIYNEQELEALVHYINTLK
ncbi:MAG: cytochrome c [Bacteroidota bacterium]